MKHVSFKSTGVWSHQSLGWGFCVCEASICLARNNILPGSNFHSRNSHKLHRTLYVCFMSTSHSLCQRQTFSAQLSRAGTPVKVQLRRRHDAFRLPRLVEPQHLDDIH